MQTRPFQANTDKGQHMPQGQEDSEALSRGFDLTRAHSFSLEGEVSSTLNQPLQAKLTIGQSNDKYEQEADRVAQAVVQQLRASSAADSSRQPLVQPQDEDTVQRQGILQRKAALDAGTASPTLESSIHRARSTGRPLDDDLQQQMGQTMGADFSDVKIHSDHQADQLNRSIQAMAFTTGKDVFFRQGAYQPGSPEGQKLIAHELTHVMQQNGAAVQQQELREGESTIKHANPVNTLQRSLNVSVEQYKTNSGDLWSGPRNRVVAVDDALQKYRNEVPKGDNNLIKANNSMDLEELKTTRQLLDNLMDKIDHYLSLDNLAEKRITGTYDLRVQVQAERMQVTKWMANKKAFLEPEELEEEELEGIKNNPEDFIEWMEQHPRYLTYAGQGAGACITSVEKLEELLSPIFEGNFKVMGLLAFAASDPSKVANHFVVIVNIGGKRIIIDPTQIQFLGGKPQIAEESDWKLRLKSVKIAFDGASYEPAQAIKVKDCENAAEAIQFAGEDRRKLVKLAEMSGESDL